MKDMVKGVSQLSTLRNGIADNEKYIMCSGVCFSLNEGFFPGNWMRRGLSCTWKCLNCIESSARKCTTSPNSMRDGCTYKDV
jgi:hypothetical protein